MLDRLARVGRVLDDVPERDDVEARRFVILLEEASWPDADAVLLRTPGREPAIRLAPLRLPAPLCRGGKKTARRGPDVEECPRAVDELLDLGERGRERALPRVHLRHVNRVFALGIAREDQVAPQPRVDVLEAAAPALDEPIDEQLVS